eukprot:m.104110 g.104110  ORF g.104110 m.104110 type:complete len:52 (-) comp15232_c1_seq32:126-281(-)
MNPPSINSGSAAITLLRRKASSLFVVSGTPTTGICSATVLNVGLGSTYIAQ